MIDIPAIVAAVPALAPYATYLCIVIAVNAVIAPYLKPPAMPAHGWYPVVYALVNWVARNVRNARNANAPVPPSV